MNNNEKRSRYEHKLRSRMRDERKFLNWINANGIDCNYKTMRDYEAHAPGRFGSRGIWQTFIRFKRTPWESAQKRWNNRKIRVAARDCGFDDICLPIGSGYKRYSPQLVRCR